MKKVIKKMGVFNYETLAFQLYANYRNSVYKYFDGKENLMIGGGNEITQFKLGGTIFNFYKINDEESIHYHLFQDDKFQKFPDCLYIIVNKKERLAVLDGLTYNSKCFSDDNKKNLVKFQDHCCWMSV